MEGSGSGAAIHETVEGSGSGTAPHEVIEESGSSSAPHETVEGSGSGATPHETRETSPLPWSRGQARNGPAQTSRGRDLGIRPQNASAGRGHQRKLLIPLFSSFFHFYFDLMVITFVHVLADGSLPRASAQEESRPSSGIDGVAWSHPRFGQEWCRRRGHVGRPDGARGGSQARGGY